MSKQNKMSKVKITNGDDHNFLEFLKINFPPVNYTFFPKNFYQASSSNSKFSKNTKIER
jgi:hypothetical protein